MHVLQLNERTVPYWIGDIVYQRVAEERRRGMITGVSFRAQGEAFEVTWAHLLPTWHAAIELATEHIPEWESNIHKPTSLE